MLVSELNEIIKIADKETIRVFNTKKVSEKLGKLKFLYKTTHGLTENAIEQAFKIAMEDYRRKLIDKAMKKIY